MPIVVESLNHATEQDRMDLQKIYLDAPQWLFAPFAGDAQLIEACLQDGSLIAGRFNDRLLGAAHLQRGVEIWHMSQLCVRKVTRRRGVAERLVRQAQTMAAQSGASLRLLAPAGHLEAQALSAKLNVPLDALSD
ncbi:PanM family protein [Pseudomonas sp. SWRI74]|jgi:ribosomal protein S18 acetylase RimI-like enzyme|uniref:PanM family protein n=1 Tax=Pseudomonas azerbaijanoccidentalis TaxID=2842347 RepID=A0ABS6QYU5_9PSED|nr:acetyl-CoA sensor PanZ family protein [Pseudomonas azerbaijanoccidentalis]MBV4524100.1 PanM family protein [Pseudomonas azerbaijanoccidentalis]